MIFEIRDHENRPVSTSLEPIWLDFAAVKTAPCWSVVLRDPVGSRLVASVSLQTSSPAVAAEVAYKVLQFLINGKDRGDFESKTRYPFIKVQR